MMTFSWLRVRTPRVLACLVFLALAMALSPGFATAGAWQASHQSTAGQLLPGVQVPGGNGDQDEETQDTSNSGPLLPPIQAPGEEGDPDITSPIQDSDGDGIPNVQDPDDDNGGVADDQDPDPFDPNVEPPPPSDPLSPIHDDDGDGIPNIQDPDDDNDGISDDEDPGETAAVPQPGGGSTGGGSSAGGNAASGKSGSPVVLSLPSTGSGDAGTGPVAPWGVILAMLAVVVIGSGRLVVRRG